MVRPPLASPRPGKCSSTALADFDLPLPVCLAPPTSRGRGSTSLGRPRSCSIASSARTPYDTPPGSRGGGPTARSPSRRFVRSSRPASSCTTTSLGSNLLAIAPFVGRARARRGAPRGHVPGEQPSLRADPRGGDDRCADRPRQPAGSCSTTSRAGSTARACAADAPQCSSTSTASRATTTRSATRPVTHSSSGWARSWRLFFGSSGAAYRLGGNEFCLLGFDRRGRAAEPLIDRACEALTEHGDGFEIETSFGAIVASRRAR